MPEPSPQSSPEPEPFTGAPVKRDTVDRPTPQSLSHALIDLLWPLPKRSRILFVTLATTGAVALGIWATLPDAVKVSILLGRQAPPATPSSGSPSAPREIVTQLQTTRSLPSPDTSDEVPIEFAAGFDACSVLHMPDGRLLVIYRDVNITNISSKPGVFEVWFGVTLNRRNGVGAIPIDQLPEEFRDVKLERPLFERMIPIPANASVRGALAYVLPLTPDATAVVFERPRYFEIRKAGSKHVWRVPHDGFDYLTSKLPK